MILALGKYEFLALVDVTSLFNSDSKQFLCLKFCLKKKLKKEISKNA